MRDIEKSLMLSTKIYDKANKSDFFFSDPKTDLQVGIYLNSSIYIVFRGTDSLEDVTYDLTFEKTKFDTNYLYDQKEDDSKIHKGFHDQLFKSKIYQDFFDKTMEILNSRPFTRVYITGHSLGGALATIFGYVLSKYTYKFITVHSFASPKIGDRKWKCNFKNRHNLHLTRVIVSSDPVPLFPIFNYYHINNNVLKLDTNYYFYNLGSHSIDKYSKLMKKIKLKKCH